MKNANRKSQNDFIALEDLKPDFNLKLSQEVKTGLSNFKGVVEEYVQLHNDYVRMKINEEKAKTKKPRMNEEKLDQQLASKYEKTTFEAEMSRVVKEMVKNIPDEVKPILEQNWAHLDSNFD